MSNYEVKVKANLDTSEAQQKLKALQNGNHTIKVKTEIDSSKVDDLLKKFKGTQTTKFKFDADTSGMEKFTSSLNKMKKYVSSYKLDVDVSKANASIQKFSGQTTKTLEKARTLLDQINKDFTDVKFAPNNDVLSDSYKKLQTHLSQYNNLMKKAKIESDNLGDSIKKAATTFNTLDAITAGNRTETWLKNNSKAAKEYGETLEELARRQKAATSKSELAEYTKQVNMLKSEASARGMTGLSTTEELKRAFSQISQFAGIYNILENVIVDGGRAMAQAVLQVDDAMTDLQMATGVSQQRAAGLMSTYADLGQELKATMVDVSASATEWLKQGKSIEESQKLARDSIVLSKIGDLSSEDSTKTITAAMKSYDMAESEVMNFVDEISAIDMASATDVGGLATAFNEVAANAKQAGVSTKQLLSYAAVIGETTQEGMASVGTSLNAIFSRMGNIKLARLKDYQNNGEDLSNVETVLRGVGIQLRDSQNEFRDFDDVLADTANRWESFSGVQQRAVSQAFAGTHHMNDFMVLMQNWENVEKYIETADNSSGQSMQKFEAYQESLSGKLEGLKGQFQELSTVTLDSDFLKGLVDGATAALNVVTELVDKVGILPMVLGGIGTAAFFKNLDRGKSSLHSYSLLLSGSIIVEKVA
ncbi:MAG: phage tail tape measure protein [Sellimonas intestinalis]|uniref:phage tail tape measure protein n=1 Tax=Sellimonas intestinalis TaxID=1653434 RepID=UPI00399A2799